MTKNGVAPLDALPVAEMADADIVKPVFGAIDIATINAVAGENLLLRAHIAALEAAFDRQAAQIAAMKAGAV